MTTLALLEHLEKVPYLLSLFLPTAVFFLAGLALAWWIWHKDHRRLDAALAELDRLSSDLSSDYQKEHDLGARVAGLYRKQKDHWEAELENRDAQISKLKKDLSAATTRIADLDRSFGDYQKKSQAELEERNSKLGGLESDLAKNSAAFGLLQTKHNEGKGESDQLLRTIADLKKGSSEKDIEINDLREELSRLEKSSIRLPQEVDGLQSDLAAEESSTPESAAPQAFFANSDVSEDETLGYLYHSRPSQVDDLTKISGVGEVLEPKLNNFGIYQYQQIALWSQKNIDAFSDKLDFKGRVERDEWVTQAADLHAQKYGTS